MLHNNKKPAKLILCGDWNINIMQKSKYSIQLSEIINSYNMIFHIKCPTRIASCIDLIVSNIRTAKGSVYCLALSDHDNAQILNVPSLIIKSVSQEWVEYVRDYSKNNVESFLNCLSSLTFSKVYAAYNANESFQIFYDLFILFYNLSFPIIRVKSKTNNKNNSWVTKGLRVSCLKKRMLFMHYRFTYKKNINNRKDYIKYNQLLRKCIRKSKILQNKKILNNHKNKCKAAWDIIQDNINDSSSNKSIGNIIYENKTYSKPCELSKLFNEHFVNIQKDVLIPKCAIKNTIISNTIENHNNTLFLMPTDSNEISKIILNLNNTKSVGTDDIRTDILKKSSKFISSPLSHIINLSFEQGEYPEQLKLAIVKPIFKKGDPNHIDNYRPITINSVLAKIFEKAFLIRLNNFFEINHILTNKQFGFRNNSSTTLACFNLIKIITEALNEKKLIASIFLDMSKAFDFVHHETLLNKLEKYGVRGNAFNWIKSYLAGRQQCTEITKIVNGVKISNRSNFLTIERGVPQGSVLGPFLFLVYNNDLPGITSHPCILFADDTTVAVTCDNSELYEHEISSTLDMIINWLNNNHLKVNLDKTKIVQFSNYNSRREHLAIKYNSTLIEEVSETKFLGIIFDTHCNWKSHIDYVCSKLDRFIYALRRLTVMVSKDVAKSAYYGYVSSVLTYGLIIWGNSVDAIRVFKLQKKCVRAIYNVRPRESCKPLYKELKILPLPCLYIRELCIFVRRYPEYFPLSSNLNCDRSSRYPNKLLFPTSNVGLYQRNAYVMAIKVFNKLPQGFKDLPYNKFKKILTGWLLEELYYTIDDYLNKK